MRKIFTLCVFFLSFTVTSVYSATGWFQDYVLINPNGAGSNHYWIGSNPNFGTQLQGNNFGTVSSLVITGCDMRYWSDTQDRLGGAFYYKIMSADGNTQITAPVENIWNQSGPSGNDYQGFLANLTIDLLSGLSANTTYQLHVWAKSWGSNQGDSWLTNSGANYVATFTTQPNTFTGSGLWSSASNWNFGVPANTSNANISGNVTVNSDVTISSLTINNGYSLTINPTFSLTVNGTLTNSAGNAGIVIKSGGSLIHNTADVPGAMEREVANADWTAGLDGWHLLSSPVENQLLANGGFTTDPYDFYAWDEVTNIWLNQKEVTSNITAFIPGKGYLVSYDAGGTKTFAGEFNVGNQAFTNLTKTGDFWFTGFHLLGNPFASAIKWNDGNWALSNISTVASVWGETAQNYLSLSNPNAIIPANQGFFVYATSATNAITIPAAARTHSTTPFYKSVNADVLKFRITNSANETYDETVVRLNPAATTGYDQEFDGYKLFGSSTAPQLFTYFGPEEYVSVNTLPLENVPDFIEIGLRPGAETTYTISSVENTMSLPVMLEDLFTGTFVVLGENTSYDFSAKPGDSEVRFILHFSGTVDAEKPMPVTESLIYSYQNIIYVKNAPANSTITLTSITGQVLMRAEATGSGLTTLNAEKLPKGVYVVSLIAGGKQISRKVVL
jgi:hypothetical protein